jgi:glycerophosphoryl diester phosphodiesterase
MHVIGHRGAAALAPENTWPGFDVALSIGVDAIETDVQATSDGELVLLHDDRLDRTTNGHGLLRETPWSVVRELDAGAWFDETYQGARIPRLDATLFRYGQRIPFAIEIKQPGIELRVLDMVSGFGLLGRVTFTSFHFDSVAQIKAALPAAKAGFLTRDVDDAAISRVLAARIDQFCPPAGAVTSALVQMWKRRGLEVRAWGVKDTTVMMQAVAAGVDGMTVDFPHLLLKALGRM